MRDLTSSELTELEAFWNLENGWGEWKQDYRIGQLTSLLANIYRDTKKRQNPYSMEDFALRPQPTKQTDSKQERSKRIQAMLNAFSTKNAKRTKNIGQKTKRR